MSKAAPFYVIAGTGFWALFAAALATKNDTLMVAVVIYTAVVLVTIAIIKSRQWGAERKERKRIWTEGQKTTARVISIRDRSAPDTHPDVELVLEVQGEDDRAYRAGVQCVVSRVAIPRLQPDCEIMVRVDRDDPQKVVIDEELTPYGYR
jgi:hypothetical protein